MICKSVGDEQDQKQYYNFEIENLVPYHNEVTLSTESILANVPVEYNVIDSRGTFGDKQRFGDLFAPRSWPSQNHGLPKLVFSITQQHDGSVLPLQENVTYVMWIHEPFVISESTKQLIADKSIAIIFLTIFIRDKWRGEFEKYNKDLKAFSMIPVFDTSLLINPNSNIGGKRNNYIVLPGLISKRRRDFRSLMAAYDRGTFPESAKLVLLGPKPGQRQLPTTLDKGLSDRFTLIHKSRDLQFTPFFQTITGSRGIFLGIAEVDTDTKKSGNKYFQDKSSGNVALAISLGVPIIGDSRLGQYVPEVLCCALLYNRLHSNRSTSAPVPVSASASEDQPLMLRDAVSGDMEVRDLGSLHFDTLQDLLHWLGALSEYEMEKMKDHILRRNKEFLQQNAVLMRDSIIPTASNK